MPISFNNVEINLLKDLTKGHPELNDKLNHIESGVHYQSYMESVKEDVLMNIENGGYENINNDDLERIITQVSNYDYSDYNEFIDMTINNIINKK